jgi:hypothetical protein
MPSDIEMINKKMKRDGGWIGAFIALNFIQVARLFLKLLPNVNGEWVLIIFFVITFSLGYLRRNKLKDVVYTEELVRKNAKKIRYIKWSLIFLFPLLIYINSRL